MSYAADGGPGGIRLLSGVEDGRHEQTIAADRAGVRTVGFSDLAQSLSDWLYFAIDEGFKASTSGPVTVEVQYFDEGAGPIILQYNSTESTQRHAPQFDPAYMPRTLVYRQNTAQWRTVSFALTDARFANREEQGADFRLAAYHGALSVRRVTITRGGPVLPEAVVSPPAASPAAYPAPLGDRAAFTYFFYWYDARTGRHMSPFTDVPTDFRTISYRDVTWQRRQLEDMAYAGIDTVLPVYWYSPEELSWSKPGIEVLAQALEQVREGGTTPPSVGMFLDTTSAKGKDLRLDGEQAVLYANIHFFFSTIPRPYWALAEGSRPVIWAYTSEAPSGYNQSTIDYVYRHFESDFGVRPYLVFDGSWTFPVHTAEGGGRKVTYSGDGRLRYDASYWWGGAVRFRTSGMVTSIGPGFGPLPPPDGSQPLLVDREDGGRLRAGLRQAIACPAPWLAIETWNELHEATDVAESLNYGRQYIEMLRQWLPYFKAGQLPEGTLVGGDKCVLD